MQHDLILNASIVLRWAKSKLGRKFTPSSTQQLRFVDLFSGCGGLSYGVKLAGQEFGFETRCALAVDTDKTALEVYRDNIPHLEDSVINADILEMFSKRLSGRITHSEKLLKEKIGEIDFLVAGPPCQGHSDLNNSTRRNDPRNGLYLACIRAIELFEPDLVIIENVPAVIHSVEKVVQTTEKSLTQKGYYVKCMTVNFLNLGIPQKRKRHVLIATKDRQFCENLNAPDANFQKPTLREFFSGVTIEENLMYQEGRLSQENVQRVNYLFDNDLFDLPDERRPSCHKNKEHSYKSVYGRLSYDEPAQTLTSGYGSMGQGRYIHPSERRTINSREAARIQGFPDCFDFSKVKKITELRQMIANAVPPQLSYVIISAYIKYAFSKARK